MRSAIRTSLAALAALLLAAPSRADTLKVPAEFETIQDAVDAAVAGDTVLVTKGRYAENVTVSTAGITLKGKSATIDGRYLGSCIVVSAADVEVTGFTLLHGGDSAIPEGPGDGGGVGGLHVIGTGADISKLDVRACEDFGIHLEGTGVIEKCDVDSCLGPGIWVDTDDVLGEVVTEVSKNDVRRCGIGLDFDDGPFLVSKNTAEANLDDGIAVDIPPLLVEGIALASEVSKNDCRHNGGDGLQLFKFSGPDFVVDKNVLEQNDAGLFAAGFTLVITDNTIEDNLFGGASLYTTSADFTGNKVKGNGRLGVFVASAAVLADGGSTDGSNFLEGNTVQDNGGDGIHVVSDSNTVEDNTVKGNLGDGIQLVGAGVILNHVAENTVLDNGHDGIDNWADSTLLHGNVSKDNGGADIAGVGDGGGTTDEASADNVSGDGTDLLSEQELELETL